MKRRAIVSLAILSLLLGLSACGAKGGAPESGAESSKVEQGSAEDREESKAEKAEEESSAKIVVETGAYLESTQKLETGDKPESTTVTWAQGASGNVLVSIAKAQGYFEEVGLTVNEIPLDENQIQAVSTGQVDIASNTGTWAPLKNIIAGDEDLEFYENAQKFYQEHNTNS